MTGLISNRAIHSGIRYSAASSRYAYLLSPGLMQSSARTPSDEPHTTCCRPIREEQRRIIKIKKNSRSQVFPVFVAILGEPFRYCPEISYTLS